MSGDVIRSFSARRPEFISKVLAGANILPLTNYVLLRVKLQRMQRRDPQWIKKIVCLYVMEKPVTICHAYNRRMRATFYEILHL